MRAYSTFLRARARVMLQYRAAAVAGVGTQVFWGFIRVMVLAAFYASSRREAPMHLEDVIAYVWLGQALFSMMPWFHDLEIEALIRRGDVAYELVRPLDLYALWAARTLATRLARVGLRALPIVVFAAVLLPALGAPQWRLEPPASPAAAVAFAVAIVIALGLSVAITMLVHASLLFTISGDGMARIMPGLVIVFSGMVVPLPLFPDWAQGLLALLPFRGVADVPFRIYSGDISMAHVPLNLAGTLVWTGILVLLGRAITARGLRRAVVQGG